MINYYIVSSYITKRLLSALFVAAFLIGPGFTLLADTPTPGTDSGTIILTAREQEYLNSKKELTMVVDPKWKPYDFIENGRHLGIGADYMRLISERLGVPLTLIPTQNWVESLETARMGECDIVTMLNKTQDREKYLDFTDPLFTSQIVIVSKERVWLTNGLNDLAGKKVAVGEGYWLDENIRRDFPEIDLVTMESPADTIRLVAEGKVFATVVTLIEAMLIIRQEAYSDLRIIGPTDYQNKLRLGVQKGDSILLGILQKSVQSISEKEDKKIFSKWASVTIEEPFNYPLLWKISGGIIIAFAVFLYWNRKLFKLNQSLKIMHIELEQKNRELENLSITDKLTGLYNRMKLDFALKIEIERSRRYKGHFSVILMDIDHFKQINDTHGHHTGDQVLQITSHILRSNIREVDIAGRWGGEEFLLICPNTDKNGALTLAENLRLKIEEQKCSDSVTYSASFGVCEYKSGDTETSLLQKVDKALYKAKHNGRNLVEIC